MGIVKEMTCKAGDCVICKLADNAPIQPQSVCFQFNYRALKAPVQDICRNHGVADNIAPGCRSHRGHNARHVALDSGSRAPQLNRSVHAW